MIRSTHYIDFHDKTKRITFDDGRRGRGRRGRGRGRGRRRRRGEEVRIKVMRTRIYLKAAAEDKASLSFGRTLAGIVWCFWGMFHTTETTTMEYLVAELARNLIYFYELYIMDMLLKYF